MNTTDLKSFHYLENGQVAFSYFDTINSTKNLKTGFYELSFNENKREVELKVSSNKEEIKIHAESLKGSTLDQIKQFGLDKVMDLKTYDNQRKKIGFINYNSYFTSI